MIILKTVILRNMVSVRKSPKRNILVILSSNTIPSTTPVFKRFPIPIKDSSG